MMAPKPKETALARVGKKTKQPVAKPPYELRNFGLSSCHWSIEPEVEAKSVVKRRSYWASITRMPPAKNAYGSVKFHAALPESDDNPQAELEAIYLFHVAINDTKRTGAEYDEFLSATVGTVVWQHFRVLMSSMASQSFFTPPPLPPTYKDVEILDAPPEGLPA